MVQSSLCQSSARKLWLFLKASERLLIAEWLAWTWQGKEPEVDVQPAVNPVLLGFAAPSSLSLLLFWGTRPLDRWFWIPAKNLLLNGIPNFQAFLLISQSNFLYKYNPPQVVLEGPGAHSHMLLGCNRKSLKYMQQKYTQSQLSLKLNFLSYSSCGYGHF